MGQTHTAAYSEETLRSRCLWLGWGWRRFKAECEGLKPMSGNIVPTRWYPTMPEGVEVASYKTYEQASKAVELLAEKEFPIDNVSIVGSGVHTVEKINGRLTPGKVALGGAAQGLTWGMLMALMSFVLVPEGGAVVPLVAIIIGILAGMTIMSASWAMSSKKRMFSSQNQLVANRYAILVTESQDRAYQILKDSEGNQVRVRRKPARLVREEDKVGGPPTEYGSRVDEQPRFGVRLDGSQAKPAGAPEEKPPSDAR